MIAVISAVVAHALVVARVPAGGYPVDHRPLPASAGVSHAVTADFDGDGRADTAYALLESRGRVAIWMYAGNGRGFPLAFYRPGQRSRSIGLEVWNSGDRTCPRVVAGRRECGRVTISRRHPALAVSFGGRADHIFYWNNYDYGMEEVFP